MKETYKQELLNCLNNSNPKKTITVKKRASIGPSHISPNFIITDDIGECLTIKQFIEKGNLPDWFKKFQKNV